MLTLFALAPLAAAAENQVLVWDITLDGREVGHRTETVKYLTNTDGSVRRILEVWTEVDGSILGFKYSFRERLTADISGDVASFHAVADLSGSVTEVQARRGATSWTITTNFDGRETTREWPANSIDLSTADLIDPATSTPIGQFDQVRVLSAETGDIYEGPVKRLGESTVVVDAKTLVVEGYSWTSEDGVEGKLWYTPDGFLAKYEMEVMGRRLIGTLADPPPAGTDGNPVSGSATGITEVNL